ncbi:YfcC family protein [Clostridium botulinum]|nr:YfcC family protein [Clostridium botulinum]NCI21586.1 YfcC family protein [Clostridium botulinum]NCI36651.1 YfcC family protein [Clostridium botulinum]NCI74811.1 YfcC family protein [Clostridium botulinum]NDI40882.1 YfcC family protein [Clostridium botulinum]NEZ73630.1 YfcC family protein [Clostridium botulinum]
MGGIVVTKKKKKISFPTAFTVLFIVLVIAAILTYVVPAGSYSKLSYDNDSKVFVVTKPDESTNELPATQKTLDKLKIKVSVEKFKDGSINKPVAIPDTYEQVEQKPQGFFEVIEAPIKGVYDTIDIIMFVLILGGVIGVVNSSGAFDAGIAKLSVATKGKEYLLIVIITTLIALGGTTFGLAEETIALYPILVPVFIAAGYDALVCIAALYMGSSIGTMFATVNPFSVVIASNTSGISIASGFIFRIVGLILAVAITIVYIVKYGVKVKKDPSKSIIYEQRKEIQEKFLKDYSKDDITLKFSLGRKLMLIIFALTFVVMIWGVAYKKWWFTEMTALFLVVGIILGIISRMGEKNFVDKFVAGSADLVGVALVIGVARSINLVMENGMISDTILYHSSNMISGMNSSVFIIFMLIVFIGLGFFIPSSSGLAVLSMPIMAPLADSVGLPRETIVNAYMFGQGLISFITPTGLILATLAMVDVTYDKWIKFIMPLMGYIAALSAIMLLIQSFVA